MTSTPPPTQHSVLQLIPASGAVEFTARDDDDETAWTLPMIGYGVVVTWVDEEGIQTDVDPEAIPKRSVLRLFRRP